MKHIATAALMLNLGVAAVYAQQKPVNMTLSGTAVSTSSVNLNPGTPLSEYDFGGDGTLGPFTFRTFSATAPTSPQPSTCSGATKLYFTTIAGSGAGVFRFQDGSLLKVNLTQGSDCIDLVANDALCIRTFQITGGTGRFKNASGTVTLTETLGPVLNDASNNPTFFTTTGEITGTISGVATDEGPQNGQQ
jgi:hypothetical protein